jgi:hypothetical protein
LCNPDFDVIDAEYQFLGDPSQILPLGVQPLGRGAEAGLPQPLASLSGSVVVVAEHRVALYAAAATGLAALVYNEKTGFQFQQKGRGE